MWTAFSFNGHINGHIQSCAPGAEPICLRVGRIPIVRGGTEGDCFYAESVWESITDQPTVYAISFLCHKTGSKGEVLLPSLTFGQEQISIPSGSIVWRKKQRSTITKCYR